MTDSPLYRALSVSVLCAALVAWAWATADLVRISAAHSPWFGLWLISPIALSCAALVWGYRQYNLRERLLPRTGASPPTANDRLRFYLFILLPWLALYEVVLAIGMPPDAISGMSRFEQRLPVLEWSQIIYASTYFLTILAPVFAKTRSDLIYSIRALWTMLVAYPAFLLIPLIAPKRPFTAHTIPGRLLLWERTLDSPVAAFPSFHVIWAMLAADVFARRWPKQKGLFYAWAILIAASCVTTSQHSILDVIGGAATVALVVRGPEVWAAVRAVMRETLAERLATARQHGFYAGFGALAGIGAFLGLWLAETLAGAGRDLLTPLSATGVWLALAAFAVGAPLALAVSRLRSVGIFGAIAIAPGIATTLILTRLWLLAAPLHLIVGLYFVLAGLASFVADLSQWKGPSQRTVPSEWKAAASVLAGALLTALGSSAPAPKPHFAWNTLLPAALFGLAVAIVAGLDLPAANRRVAASESHQF